MKHLFMIFVFFLSCQAFAFNPIFVDRTGLKWSQKISEALTNGCVDSQNEYNGNCSWYIEEESDSEAQKACLLIKGRLPTKLEYESLIKEFDHIVYKDQLRLTKYGLLQMKSAFHDMGEFDFYWTSTPIERVYKYPITYMLDAFMFDAYESIRSIRDRSRYLGAAVRCVAR